MQSLTYKCDECQDEPNKQVKETLIFFSFMCILDERFNEQEINSETLFIRIEEINSVVQNSKS